MSEELSYALLIDAENISSKYIKVVLDELSNYGVATYRRIYGDWTNPANVSWKSVLLNYSVNPVQQYSYTYGKNASDSAMIIDAMDILYSGHVDGFCIVSSDSDFTRLASRLRESGKHVIGMGESKTPSAFISACNLFKYLDILYSSEEEKDKEREKELMRSQAKEAAKAQEKDQLRALAKEEDKAQEKEQLRGPVKEEDKAQEKEQLRGPVKEEDKEREKELMRDQVKQAVRKRVAAERSAKGQPAKTEPVKPEPVKPEPAKAPEQEKAVPAKTEASDRPQPQTKLNTIRRSLRTIISEGSDEDGWISASKIGNQLAKRFPDFDVRNYGYSKLNQFIESLGEYEMDQIKPNKDSKVQHIYFRIKEDSSDHE